MNTFLLEGPGGLPGLKQLPAGAAAHTKKQFAFDGGVSVGGIGMGNPTTGRVPDNTPPVLASAATIAFAPAAALTTHTPTQAETINFTATAAYGAQAYLEVVTSGTTAYVITFGTNTKTTGTLSTGTVTAKTFLIGFVFDGTNWVEQSRTTAM